MRTEVQNANSLIIAQDISIAGAGITGLTVTVNIQRINDSKYWNGSAWQVGVSPRTMAEHAAYVGHYSYAIVAADLDGADYALAFPGYICEIKEATTAFLERVQIIPAVDLNQATLANSLTVYDTLKRLIALRQDNMRVIYDTWTVDGKPSHGTVYFYNTRAACLADTGPGWAGAVGHYEWTGTYDGSLRLTSYVSTREA